MKFSNVRLLVKDFAKCFKFYSEQLWMRNVFLRMDHSSPLLLWRMGTQWRRMWMWK